jgi:iron complex outermembrane receptor protein
MRQSFRGNRKWRGPWAGLNAARTRLDQNRRTPNVDISNKTECLVLEKKIGEAMRKFHRRVQLFLSVAALPLILTPGHALAQEKPGAPVPQLQEVIVTAQKREQRLQDVPVAVTALTQDVLQANRIFTVRDLSGLAPGSLVRPTSGGIQTPTITMRGQVSIGVVAGSDKQVSIYLDGVYLSNPRGSIFDLPDVERIEVLRGPQGTLFGRNATGGAVSVVTRDPSGHGHVKGEFTAGNHDQYRVRLTGDTPEFGPFSGYFSFVRRYQRGDIENANAGLTWDRSLSPSGIGVHTSPQWLGTTDSNSYFAAIKFQPTNDFKVIYKYDRSVDDGTPDGVAFVGYDPNGNSPVGVGALMTALLTSQPFPVYIDPNGRRPKIVNNGFATDRDLLVQGHSLTATWQPTDQLTVKNIFAYRQSHVFTPNPLDGLSTLTFTQAALQPFAVFAANNSVPGFASLPAATQTALLGLITNALQPQVGNRFAIITSQARSDSRQWSDELQANYNRENLHLTAGFLWFHSNDSGGGPVGMPGSATFTFIPASGVVQLGNQGLFGNSATSLAAYLQSEYHFTEQLELVTGVRVTHDKKDANFTFGPLATSTTITAPTYKKTKPNYSIGLNYKPDTDVLVYGKYGTSFVSGGSNVGVVYAPEEVKSYEIGLKADWLDRRLRTNLALFHAKYDHYQSAQGTTQPSSAALIIALTTPIYGPTIARQLPGVLSTFVVDAGTLIAKGVEAEVTATPARGVTLGGSLGYTDSHYQFVNPLVLATNNGEYALINRPRVTSTLWGEYETEPLFGDATLTFRADGIYKSEELLDIQQHRPQPELQVLKSVPGYWLLNTRVALRHMQVHGADMELAFWTRNLTDQKYPSAALIQPIASAGTFIPARSLGVDLSVEF